MHSTEILFVVHLRQRGRCVATWQWGQVVEVITVDLELLLLANGYTKNVSLLNGKGGGYVAESTFGGRYSMHRNGGSSRWDIRTTSIHIAYTHVLPTQC